MNKIYLGLFIVILLIVPIVSAGDWFGFDNYKVFKQCDRDIPGNAYGVENKCNNYGTAEIWDEGQIGEDTKLGEITLIKNTEQCFINCEAEGNATLYESGDLIEDIYFNLIEGEGIREHHIYIRDGSKTELSPYYENVCRLIEGKTLCQDELIGYREEEKPLWVEYDGSSLEPGYYEWKITGEKDIDSIVDWVITFVGKEITDWALWGTGSSLEHYYDLGQALNMIDSAGSSPGVLFNGNPEVPGKIGQAVHLNLSNAGGSAVNITNRWYGSFDNNAFTINLWINYTNPADNRWWFETGKRDQRTKFINADQMRWEVNGANGLITDKWGDTTDTWVMVTLLANSTGRHVYRNGTRIASNGDTTVGNVVSYNTMIGGSSRGGNYLSANATIDEFGIWNRSLSEAEILDLWNSGAGIPFGGGILDVYMQTPIPGYVSSNPVVTFNATTISVNGVTNLTLYIDGEANQSFLNTTANQDLSFEVNLTFADGNYNWSVKGTDGDITVQNETRFFTIDSSPPVVDAIEPQGVLGYHQVGDVIDFNYSATDTSLNTCWYSYNNTNVTTSCTTNTTIVLQKNQQTIIFYANDSINNVASDTTTWDYKIFKNNQTYDLTTGDVKQSIFILNTTIGSTITSSSGLFYYDNKSYSSTKSSSGPDTLFTSTISIPGIDADTSNKFYWSLSVTNSTGTEVLNTTEFTQYVNSSNFSRCDNGQVAVNFSTYDEGIPTTRVNTTLSGYFEWFLGTASTETKNYSTQIDGRHSFTFCIDPQFENFTVSSTLNLEANGYSDRTYNFINQNYTNSSTAVSLYLVNSTDASNIIIEVKDSGLSPLQGYRVEIYRYYEDTGTYQLIESQITDFFGQFVAKLVQNDVRYRFKFYDTDNILVKSTGDVVVACRSTICVMPFVIGTSTSDLERFDNVTGFDTSLNYNNDTQIFTFSWTDTTDDLSTKRLLVKKTGFNETIVSCNTTSSAISGTIQCDISAHSSGSFSATIYRQILGEDEMRMGLLSIEIGTNYRTFGFEGLFLSFLLLASCLALGTWSPPVGFTVFGFGFLMLGVSKIIMVSLPINIGVFSICILFAWAFRN